MNSFGKNFRVSIFGESHGQKIGVIVDGVPAGYQSRMKILHKIYYVGKAGKRVAPQELRETFLR